MRAAMKILYYMFLSSSALVMLVHGQSGFISIDCGASEKYPDETTGITYHSDEEFIGTGTNMPIDASFRTSSNPWQNLLDLRSFPQGVRNCYALKPEQGKDNNYLIRAFFLYGNYDNKNELPKFDLYLGVNLWSTIELKDATIHQYYEIIHVSQTDVINVCLVNTGFGVPFISALELRPLDNSIYQTGKGPLQTIRRYDAGTSNQNGRYKDDPYDRLWSGHQGFAEWFPIETNNSMEDSDAYKIPSEVLKTAVQSIDASTPLYFNWSPPDSKADCLIYFYFAEVQQLPQGVKRKLSISLNSEQPSGRTVVLDYLKPVTKTYPNFPIRDNRLTFSVSAVDGYGYPPILNAFEIFVQKEFPLKPTDPQDVEAIMDIQQAYKVTKDWQGDPCVPLIYRWEGLNCSDDPIPKIISLNLASSGLEGRTIVPALSNLTSLKSLDLSRNELTGPVPEFLAQLPSLTVLTLTGNKLQGCVPQALLEKHKDGTLLLSVDGNLNPCMNTSRKRKKNLPVIISILVPFVLVLGALVVIWYLIGKRRAKRRREVVSKVNGDGSLDPKNRCFSYSEVVSITDDFRKVIGKGGSGTVYGGQLTDGTQVAVKMLSPSSTQGSKQFQAEARLLTRVHHRNLALLIGYCDEGSNMGLIYEYMANGNLQEHLSGAGNKTAVLTWEQRLRIAIDAAQAFEYLHNGCKPPIIHRDVKTANILLNEKLQAKVADFGLSRILHFESGTHESITAVAGTFGYLDPEYYISNRLNEKSDVYSFGIVLLELITGQPAILKSRNNTHIVQWVNPILATGEIGSIVDPKLRGEFEINSVWKAVETAMACVPSSSIQRPNMSQVLVELKECLEMEIARESSRTSRENQETTSSTSFDTVPLEIDPSFSLGPQAR